jgi:uncharacterized protein (DUF58 family)
MGPGEPSRTEGPSQGWQVSAGGAAGAIGLLLVALGLLIGRADVAVFGLPMALSLLRGLSTAPRARPRVTVGRISHDPPTRGVRQTVTVDPAAGVEAVRLRIASRGFETAEVLVGVPERRTIELEALTARTGRQDFFRIDHVALGPDLVVVSDPEQLGPTPLLLKPGADRVDSLPLPFQLQGLTGSHGSRRPGEGGEFRDVAEFTPGDRLRRIDWKSTARRGSSRSGADLLYVRRTFATADAHVIIVVDPYDVVGPDVATWSTGAILPQHATSLDIARVVAVSLARHYIEQGDRVGLVDLGKSRRLVLPAGGRRHFDRLVHHIAVAEAGTDATPHRRAPKIPGGALVVMLSSFLDDDPARLAALWRKHGHRVLAVDVLPYPLTDFLSPEAALAFRMVMMERADRIALMEMGGVDVVVWDTAQDVPGPREKLAAMARQGRRY